MFTKVIVNGTRFTTPRSSSVLYTSRDVSTSSVFLFVSCWYCTIHLIILTVTHDTSFSSPRMCICLLGSNLLSILAVVPLSLCLRLWSSYLSLQPPCSSSSHLKVRLPYRRRHCESCNDFDLFWFFRDFITHSPLRLLTTLFPSRSGRFRYVSTNESRILVAL